MKKAGVSIIVPTHNSGDTLRECLESIKKQSYRFYETIIVDNYSVDSTVEIGKEYGARVVAYKGNAASARNVGIAKSKRKYLLFLDSDQTVSKMLISECVRICEKHDVDMIQIPETFLGQGYWSSCSAAWKNAYFLLARKNYKDNNVLGFEPRFFVEESAKSAGFFNEKFAWGEDYEFYLRLKQMNFKEAWCKSRIYHYEPKTLMEILRKNYRYGKSIAHLQKVTTKIPRRIRIIKQTYLTSKAVLQNPTRSFLAYIGVLILLSFRTLAITMGMLLSSK